MQYWLPDDTALQSFPWSWFCIQIASNNKFPFLNTHVSEHHGFRYHYKHIVSITLLYFNKIYSLSFMSKGWGGGGGGGVMNCLTRIILYNQGRILVDLIDKIILFRMNLSSQNTNQSKAEINIYVQIISTFAVFHRNVYVSVSYKRHKWYVRIYRPAFQVIAFYKINFGMRAIVANIIKKSGDYL